MNRYTYKAKSKYHKNWIYGSIVGNAIYTSEPYDEIEIIPETLCQCTGLQDRDGKDIFENDIVEWAEETLDNGTIICAGDGYIYWDVDNSSFSVKNGIFNYRLCYLKQVVKLLGNKFDKEGE